MATEANGHRSRCWSKVSRVVVSDGRGQKFVAGAVGEGGVAGAHLLSRPAARHAARRRRAGVGDYERVADRWIWRPLIPGLCRPVDPEFHREVASALWAQGGTLLDRVL